VPLGVLPLCLGLPDRVPPSAGRLGRGIWGFPIPDEETMEDKPRRLAGHSVNEAARRVDSPAGSAVCCRCKMLDSAVVDVRVARAHLIISPLSAHLAR
jgi:hypothetical protein